MSVNLRNTQRSSKEHIYLGVRGESESLWQSREEQIIDHPGQAEGSKGKGRRHKSDVLTVALSNKRDIGLIHVGGCWAHRWIRLQ